jgi:F-type H+-transporting ATPase subunit a
MGLRSVRPLFIVAFSLFFISITTVAFGRDEDPVHGKNPAGTKEEKFDAAKVIFGHILDNHEFHITDYKDGDGHVHPVSIPLPIILYSPERGFTSFMSSNFHHGANDYKGYRMLNEEKITTEKLKGYKAGQIVPVDASGNIDTAVKVYDLSITKNVVQMMLALALLTWLMLSIAKAYKSGKGVTSAPKGKQNLIEPVITFVRDEVAKPNLGHKYEKYLPYLLTVFFFILVNNLFGLIPGSANVTGNIAFTVVLGLISFVVILASSNKHYWAHIFNPPVPAGVKPILVLVEFLSVFIKPFALIIRLFANMVAGHIIIICLISLIFIFGQMSSAAGWGTSLISVAFTVFIYFIEVLVAFIQAFIFANLTAVFIGQAMEGAHHEEAAHH